MARWCDDDAFWDLMMEGMFTPKRFAETPAECDGIVALLGLSPGDRVLDLPCGVGRHSIELARRGFNVTGVDRTTRYLERARASAAGLNVEFIEADMRAFSRPGAFNAAINMYTSFGYFEDERENQGVLEMFFRSLAPGGKLLVDVLGLEVCARVFKPRHWDELPGGAYVFQEVKPARDWTWVENRWMFINGATRREFHVNHRVYAATELKGMFARAGFGDVKAYGSLAGTPYDHNATRLVVVGTRPA